MGNMTAFAAERGQMTVKIWQPLMCRVSRMAGFAGPHGVFQFRSDKALSAVAAGKLMKRFFKIFPNLNPAGVKEQVIRFGGFAFLIIKGIVDRIMAVNTVEQPLSMHIP